MLQEANFSLIGHFGNCPLVARMASVRPVIREPITGGSVQISGNFTLEEANSVAMLLRAGTLPGHLTLVEQQVIQPAAKP